MCGLIPYVISTSQAELVADMLPLLIIKEMNVQHACHDDHHLCEGGWLQE
jgi:hypothetical protein